MADSMGGSGKVSHRPDSPPLAQKIEGELISAFADAVAEQMRRDEERKKMPPPVHIHSSEKRVSETAKKVVDNVLAHSTNKKRPATPPEPKLPPQARRS